MSVGAFREALVEWFRRSGRVYPWRGTCEPYAILVSEMMLQQTRVATVLEKGFFTKWMMRFPDVATLAEATDDEILRAWAGLGYYRRARFLREAARVVVREYGGVVPGTWGELRALPGVGDYTAAAVLAFAFDRPAVMVDGNVARVLARLRNFSGDVTSNVGKRRMGEIAQELLPMEGVRDYQGALMELGQVVCRVGVPDCVLCPVRGWCEATDPSLLPVRRRAAATVRLTERVVVARDERGWILLEQIKGKRREGMWKFPDAVEEVWGGQPIWVGSYAITKYRVRLEAFAGERSGAVGVEGCVWVENGDDVALAGPYRRLWEAVCGEIR